MGAIVAAALAPHPPHLVYAENPDRNEPNAEGGWEQLRWGYERLRASLEHIDYDTIVILSPHWQTYVGTHVLGVPSFSSLSVDPIFPNLFRYQYDLEVDVGLAKSIHKAGVDAGLTMQMMENPDFRVDYGTITSCHLIDPEWSKPIVALSSNRGRHYYSVEVMQEMMIELGRATRTAIEASDRKVLLIASNSSPIVISRVNRDSRGHEPGAHHEPCDAPVGHADDRAHAGRTLQGDHRDHAGVHGASDRRNRWRSAHMADRRT